MYISSMLEVEVNLVQKKQQGYFNPFAIMYVDCSRRQSVFHNTMFVNEYRRPSIVSITSLGPLIFIRQAFYWLPSTHLMHWFLSMCMVTCMSQWVCQRFPLNHYTHDSFNFFSFAFKLFLFCFHFGYYIFFESELFWS